MSDSDSDPFRPRPLSTGEVVDLKNQVVAFEHTALILGLHALEDSPETNSQAVIGLYVGFRGGVLVWDLYPDERRGVVLPEIDRLVHAFDSIRGQFAMTRRLGTYTLLTGFALIFTSLSIALAATPVDPFVDILPVWGYTIAGSGAAWFVGRLDQLATIVTEHVVYWRQTGESLRTWKENDAAASSHRDQIDIRIVVGLLVLLLIGGALVGAANDLPAGLAAPPAFRGSKRRSSLVYFWSLS